MQASTSRPLTDAQKAAIAEARNFYESKLAEAESAPPVRRSGGRWIPTDRETLEQRMRRDREQLTSERDAKIERIRNARR